MQELDNSTLDTIFHECRQCGTCCKKYQKVLLEPDEVERLKKLGANIGYMIHLDDIIKTNIDNLISKEKAKHKIYMIHPSTNGCIFLEKRDNKYYCKIYNYRPKACRGFKCNLADNTINDLFFDDSIYLIKNKQQK